LQAVLFYIVFITFTTLFKVACGFPSGQYHFETRLREIELAINDGATEIDAVINRALVLDGDWKTFYEEIYRMKNACSGKAKIKVILSTGELINSENIYKASLGAMFAGFTFSLLFF
jgi:deoxyribose-phosphate aldolase